jgi:hypothetical protein
VSVKIKVLYWVSTLWLALGMLSTGLVQVLEWEEELAKMTHLGYPGYFMTILGAWKILGVLAILVPKFPILKEWAYAGFFFSMSGAILSHLAIHEPMEIFPALLLLLLTVVSWYFRPQNRKTLKAEPTQ